MSDYLAVGGVTAVLKSLLNAGLSEGGPSTVLVSPPGITNKPPDLSTTGQDEPAQLNLFMYYASINPALRNLNLPSVDANGNVIGNPPLAINLHYLVTAYGANPYDPEILLGFAMQVFHNTPVVPRATIQTALTALDTGTSPSNEQKLVAVSTLANQIEHIRITPEALTTEEIYRLWTAFQVSYRPTTSYQVSVVVIQSTQSYKSNRPVQKPPSLIALPLAGPMISTVSPLMVKPGQLMTISGSHFLNGPASNTLVSFDAGAPVAAATVQSNLVRVIAPNTLEAGTCNVRIMCNVTFPSGATHPAFASNAVPFQLIPSIAPAGTPPYQAKQSNPFSITVNPAVGNTQTVVVYIGDTAIPQTQGPLGPPSTSNTVAVTVPSTIAPGAYPLRVEVDGAQSLLTQDTTQSSSTYGQWLPQVEISA
jgi:Pvc16 N-terminal domain/IPT/TIG domain